MEILDVFEQITSWQRKGVAEDGEEFDGSELANGWCL